MIVKKLSNDNMQSAWANENVDVIPPFGRTKIICVATTPKDRPSTLDNVTRRECRQIAFTHHALAFAMKDSSR